MEYFLLLHNTSVHMNIPKCYMYTYIACLAPVCVTVGSLQGGDYTTSIPWLWSRFGTVPCLIFVLIGLFLFKMCLCISDVAVYGERVQN